MILRREFWFKLQIIYEANQNSVQEPHGRKLLVTGHKRIGNAGMGGGRTCMAEDVCINKFCGNGYDHTANKFPYTVFYSKFPAGNSTKFEFDVSISSLLLHQ